MKLIFKSLLVAMLALVAQSGFAQTYEEMLARYEACKDAESTQVGSMMMKMIRTFMPKEEMDQLREEEGEAALMILEQVKALGILELGKCSEADRTRFKNETRNWIPTGYEADDMDDPNYRGFIRMHPKKGKGYEIIMIDYQEYTMTYMRGDLGEEFLKELFEAEKRDAERGIKE